MNVACSSCPAKYAVPDEKVRGKKVRITCKRCGTAIIVDGTAEAAMAAPSEPAPAPAAPAATAAAKVAPKAERVRHKTMVGGLQAAANSAPGAPGARPGAASAASPVKVAAPEPAVAPAAAAQQKQPSRIERTEPALAARSGTAARAGEPRWTVAVTEDDHRDLTVQEIAGLFADRVIDAETYVWRDGMADWLTPFEVPEIAAALSAGGESDDAHDPGRASGGWHEPGRWDAQADAGAFSDEVTVAMDGDKARMLVEAASSMTASPAPPPPSSPGEEPALQTSGFTAEAAPYSPAARPAVINERRSGHAVKDLLDSLPTPAIGASEAEGGASFSSVALPLVSPRSDAPTAALPEVTPVANTSPTPTTGIAPRAAVTGARSARGDLFSKEAQASREASPRARMPSITPDVVAPPPPRGRMPSVADEPPRAKLPSVSGDPEPKPRARISSIPPPPEPQQGALTGVRNESSVLFSLEALAGKNAPKAPVPKAAEDNFLGGSAAFDDAPPSVANLQNAAFFNKMTMAVPDFAAPAAASAPEHSGPVADDGPSAVPKKSGGSLWAVLAVLALLGGGAAAYFVLYPTYVKAPEPTAPVVTSTPTVAEPSPPPIAEPSAASPDLAAAAGSVAPATSAAGSAPPASAAPSTSAAPGATAPSALPAPAPGAPAGAKPAAPAAPKPPAAPAGASEPKPATPAAAPAEKPAEPAAATEPAAAEGPPFDRDAAAAALSSAASAAVSQCSSLEGTHGSGKVTVTFVNSGRATNALVSGDFAGSALGGCVAKVFRSSKVPAFGGEVVKVTKSLQIP